MLGRLWLAGGWLCFALGVAGMVLPLVPGMVFLIAALFCFARGNPAWEAWLLAHPHYGAALREWRARRAITRPAKRAALATMAVAALIAWWAVGFPLALISWTALGAVALFVWSRPE